MIDIIVRHLLFRHSLTVKSGYMLYHNNKKDYCCTETDTLLLPLLLHQNYKSSVIMITSNIWFLLQATNYPTLSKQATFSKGFKRRGLNLSLASVARVVFSTPCSRFLQQFFKITFQQIMVHRLLLVNVQDNH